MKKKYLGIPVILFGLLMILSYYNGLSFAVNHVLGAWPIAFSFFGLNRLSNKNGKKFVNVLFVLASIVLAIVGASLGLRETAVPLFAIVLISFGLFFFFNNESSTKSNQIEGEEFDFDEADREELLMENWNKAIENSNWNFTKDEFSEILDMEDEEEKVYVNMEREKEEEYERLHQEKGEKRQYISENIIDDLNEALGDLSEKAREIGKNINNSKVDKRTFGLKRNNGFVFINEDYLTKNVLFGEDKVVIDSNEFQGANLSTTFGSLKVDLSRVQPKGRDIYITNSTIFGETKIRVPESWIVYVNGSTIFGETKIPSFSSPNPSHRLYVNNSVLFGECKIEYKKHKD